MATVDTKVTTSIQCFFFNKIRSHHIFEHLLIKIGSRPIDVQRYPSCPEIIFRTSCSTKHLTAEITLQKKSIFNFKYCLSNISCQCIKDSVLDFPPVAWRVARSAPAYSYALPPHDKLPDFTVLNTINPTSLSTSNPGWMCLFLFQFRKFKLENSEKASSNMIDFWNCCHNLYNHTDWHYITGNLSYTKK